MIVTTIIAIIIGLASFLVGIWIGALAGMDPTVIKKSGNDAYLDKIYYFAKELVKENLELRNKLGILPSPESENLLEQLNKNQ